jgi:hypothetical protein
MLTAAVAVAAPGQASAQRYYIREVIKGIQQAEPAHTYTATYSSAYGACSGGVQTAPILKCTREDSVVVANSLCGADQQQSAPKACSATCGPFSPNGYIAGAYVTLGSNVSTDAAAKTLCEAYAAKNGVVGGCVRVTTSQQYVYFNANAKASDVSYKSYYDQNVSICSK